MEVRPGRQGITRCFGGQATDLAGDVPLDADTYHFDLMCRQY